MLNNQESEFRPSDLGVLKQHSRIVDFDVEEVRTLISDIQDIRTKLISSFNILDKSSSLVHEVGNHDAKEALKISISKILYADDELLHLAGLLSESVSLPAPLF
ncbi:hypothetical protein [Xylella fastidiosa]|uniref:hypothetical protein n=1 Tax=Xylella fastidiosa TaxID=2371 RepID=UPI0011235678|nr:hypothetical protein [Xylella fastidiosa]TNW23395.1 hypothetical protein EIP73_11455 [Xylella fastidiosa subsp. pauca]TNW25953.1 hypothetical protein EIP74_06065 [Xylella fastidiosa subsp. pauca]